ncbi:MAG: DUF1538 domain-containing protein [Clostridiales bacterium]|jgi:energy-converting hydrogenase Eha subunit C|nr:DUF1538 domain-containing protein [Clostridiales bacterium]
MSIILEKFKEVLFSVLPITVIVVVVNLAGNVLSGAQLVDFLVGAAFIVIGLSVFLLGIDIGITPLGGHLGSKLSKANSIWLIIIVALVLGFFISVAEPDLQILAEQVRAVTEGKIASHEILLVVSAGIAIMLAAGFIRILYNYPLYKLLTLMYLLIGALSLLVSQEFLAISFDASGATTGALTVPFILALTVGVSSLKRDSKASEKDSFGLVAVTSTGAILGVLLMGIFKKAQNLTGVLPSAETDKLTPFYYLSHAFSESFVAIAPIVAIFIVFQVAVLHLNRQAFFKILKGLLYSLLGLTVFLAGVNMGFMNVGASLGIWVASLDFKGFAVLLGLILGVVTILAEPAVHVLTQQIESVTAGYVKRTLVLATLSVGVGLAIGLSILRIIVPGIQLWHYLLPGYIIALAMSYITPKLFVGIAFDSGGVASGPMTATFILAFSQGVAESIPGADVLKDAFGMIALVAMTPIIALETLGLIYKYKSRKALRLQEPADEQIDHSEDGDDEIPIAESGGALPLELFECYELNDPPVAAIHDAEPMESGAPIARKR